MRLRDIENPFAYLRKNGFGHHTASNLLNGRVYAVKLKHIERLCHMLHCTPNDLICYTPGPEAPTPQADPLTGLIRQPITSEPLRTIFKQLPIDRLEALRQELTDRAHSSVLPPSSIPTGDAGALP